MACFFQHATRQVIRPNCPIACLSSSSAAIESNAARGRRVNAGVRLLLLPELFRIDDVMKILILILASILAVGASPSLSADKSCNKDLVFEGTVLQIAPPVPASGVFAFYRLAKYRVERVCRGRYTKSEIVVDYLSLSTKELDAIKVGDRVCVSVEPSKKILTRTNVEGIREKSEKIKIFYIGREILPPNNPCACEVK